MSPPEIFASEASIALSFKQLQQKVLIEKHNCLCFLLPCVVLSVLIVCFAMLNFMKEFLIIKCLEL